MRIRTHTNPLSCLKEFKKLNLSEIFKKFNSQLDLEIGFGQSEFILQYAKDNPTRYIVGIEVRKKAVNIMQQKVDLLRSENIYLIHGNGGIGLAKVFEDNSIDNIFIFHPDPWIKKKHYKRRLINSDFILILQKKLKNNGKVYIATDVDFLWEDILKNFNSSSYFKRMQNTDFWQNYYSGRWDDIVKEKNKKVFFATFIFNK